MHPTVSVSNYIFSANFGLQTIQKYLKMYNFVPMKYYSKYLKANRTQNLAKICNNLSYDN